MRGLNSLTAITTVAAVTAALNLNAAGPSGARGAAGRMIERPSVERQLRTTPTRPSEALRPGSSNSITPNNGVPIRAQNHEPAKMGANGGVNQPAIAGLPQARTGTAFTVAKPVESSEINSFVKGSLEESGVSSELAERYTESFELTHLTDSAAKEGMAEIIKAAESSDAETKQAIHEVVATISELAATHEVPADSLKHAFETVIKADPATGVADVSAMKGYNVLPNTVRRLDPEGRGLDLIAQQRLIQETLVLRAKMGPAEAKRFACSKCNLPAVRLILAPFCAI